LRIVEEAERCTEPGDIGRLLRREGLYSSHLTKWREAHRDGALHGLRSKKRGVKRKASNPLRLIASLIFAFTSVASAETIDCSTANACDGQTLSFTSMPALHLCSGFSSCNAVTVHFVAGGSMDVSCTGDQSCRFATINLTDSGSGSLACSGGGSPCKSVIVNGAPVATSTPFDVSCAANACGGSSALYFTETTGLTFSNSGGMSLDATIFCGASFENSSLVDASGICDNFSLVAVPALSTGGLLAPCAALAGAVLTAGAGRSRHGSVNEKYRIR
jgi:hypothetical protein